MRPAARVGIDGATLALVFAGAAAAGRPVTRLQPAVMSSVPTAGGYPLYPDFRVDDRVHTATFVLDAA